MNDTSKKPYRHLSSGYSLVEVLVGLSILLTTIAGFTKSLHLFGELHTSARAEHERQRVFAQYVTEYVAARGEVSESLIQIPALGDIECKQLENFFDNKGRIIQYSQLRCSLRSDNGLRDLSLEVLVPQLRTRLERAT